MKFLVSLFFLALSFVSIFAQKSEDDRRSNMPVEPFRIIGNVYYVGASEVTSFLIVTPKGHILVDAGFPQTAPQIIKNIRTLGFKPEEIRLMVNTQAHFDHAGGFAELKRLSGAKMIASPLDKVMIEDGGKNDFTWGDELSYEPIKVDRVIQNREKISLGGATLTAIFTPGHTKGCTAWEYTVTEKGRKYKVLFWGSASSPGYKFFGNKNYPDIVADYEKTFAVMKTLKPDVFLASHGSFFDLFEKAEKIRARREPNPFIDSDEFGKYAADAEKAHRAKLAEQKKAVSP
ncbi:MAG TPA: subclass B3 metallo-beta-lactamase [Pyrinomonadaceae bacterium]|nr:subclass B3 metallo-beta-lactamase [Acidobacteriota bacterium]HQZ97175.1 subclass B3 metallo-beta-lactamase [Pyrinomonadaceae bacterium]